MFGVDDIAEGEGEEQEEQEDVDDHFLITCRDLSIVQNGAPNGVTASGLGPNWQTKRVCILDGSDHTFSA